MKAVLVTGAAGFIGSNLTRTLLAKGEKVIGLDNFITGQPAHIKKLQQFPNFTFFKHDIVKPIKKLTTNVYRLTSIYHLACPTGVPNLTPLGEEMLLTSSVGTHNILELAKVHSAKVIFTSSSEVYGNPLVSPQKEEYTGNVDPTGIRSTYEEGKRFAESLIMLYVRKYKLNATIARVFNVYGPGMAPSETRVIPRMIIQAIKDEPIPVQGDGSQTRTFCYVDDMVKGVILLMEKGRSGEVYNLGSDQEITMMDLATQIKKTTRTTARVSRILRPSHDHNSRHPDLAKITKLGWKQTVDLEEGLQRTIQYFRAHT